MPGRYLIDSNVIIDFQLAGRLEALLEAASIVPLAAVEQVYDEVATPAPGDRPDTVGKKRSANGAIRGSRLRIVAFLPGSPAEGLYTALVRPGATTHDRGEEWFWFVIDRALNARAIPGLEKPADDEVERAKAIVRERYPDEAR